jgi:hypothetical protein
VEIARSVNGVPIRLAGWPHIVKNRDEMTGREYSVLEAIVQPDWITRGYQGSLIAWKGFGRKRYLCVIYYETAKCDGFVMTAFLTSKPKRNRKVWPTEH